MKDFRTALILTMAFILLTGFGFPALMWGIGQTLFPHQANGSLLYDAAGNVIGSEILGQDFKNAKYFHPRLSAAGSGYDAANSSGTNLGPTSSKLFHGLPDDPATPDIDESYAGVESLAKAYRAENSLPADAAVPVDAVTRSSSGLDPHISLQNAVMQALRISKSRGIPKEKIIALIEANTEHRFLGIFGEKRVNVLLMNLSLDKHDQ